MSPEPFRLIMRQFTLIDYEPLKSFLTRLLKSKELQIVSFIDFSIVIQYFAFMFLKGKYNYVNLLVQTMKKRRNKPAHLRLVMWHLPQSFLNYHSVCRRKRKKRRVTLIQKVPFNTEMKRMKMKAIIVSKGEKHRGENSFINKATCWF